MAVGQQRGQRLAGDGLLSGMDHLQFAVAQDAVTAVQGRQGAQGVKAGADPLEGHDALLQLVASKTKLVSFPDAVLDASFKEAMALYSEISAKNANWKKVYDDFSAFRRDANLWFRFTEATFDDFMQRQKL